MVCPCISSIDAIRGSAAINDNVSFFLSNDEGLSTVKTTIADQPDTPGIAVGDRELTWAIEEACPSCIDKFEGGSSDSSRTKPSRVSPGRRILPYNPEQDRSRAQRLLRRRRRLLQPHLVRCTGRRGSVHRCQNHEDCLHIRRPTRQQKPQYSVDSFLETGFYANARRAATCIRLTGAADRPPALGPSALHLERPGGVAGAGHPRGPPRTAPRQSPAPPGARRGPCRPHLGKTAGQRGRGSRGPGPFAVKQAHSGPAPVTEGAGCTAWGTPGARAEPAFCKPGLDRTIGTPASRPPTARSSPTPTPQAPPSAASRTPH